MGGGDDDAALLEMVAHVPAKQHQRPLVEAARRLVQKPDRPRRDEEPRQRQAPPLACRQYAGWKSAKRFEPEAFKPALHCLSAEKVLPEPDIFLNRERRLDAMLMSDHMRLLADREI